MSQGITVNFKSYKETIPQVLKLIKLENELKKFDKIILLVNLEDSDNSTSPEFIEPILRFCLENKNPVSEIFIASGADGADTIELFNSKGYKKLSEAYSIGLIDLNGTETKEIENANFMKFSQIIYPLILLDSFIISLTRLSENTEYAMHASLSNMLNAFPASKYKGFFSSKKNKIRKNPIKYSIHDIVQCKMPNLAVLDASDKGKLIIGKPVEVDKQASKLLGKTPKEIPYLNLFEQESQKPSKEIELIQ